MASDFERNKAWADGHRDEIERVLRAVGGRRVEIDESSFERDTKEGIDYEVRLPVATIACRIRRADQCGRLRHLTITTRSPSGRVPEVAKLAGGQVDWYLYAWAEDGRFVDWMVVDITRVLSEGLMDRAMKDQSEVVTPNGTFLYITVADLESADAIVGASWMP